MVVFRKNKKIYKFGYDFTMPENVWKVILGMRNHIFSFLETLKIKIFLHGASPPSPPAEGLERAGGWGRAGAAGGATGARIFSMILKPQFI